MNKKKRRILLVSGVVAAVIVVVVGVVLLDRVGFPKGMIVILYCFIVLGVMYGVPAIRKRIL